MTEATCTEDGAVTATCAREGCGHVYNKVIAKLGHDHEGGCVPYESNTMDEETQEDGSEHHVYRCSRCGAYDTENPEEHTFGEIVEYVLVSPAAGWHSVQSVRVCGDCGYRNHAEAFNGNYVEQTEYFTKGTVKEADYNEAGYVEYTHKDTNTTFRINLPKLTAPYEGVTYYAFELSQKEGTSLVKANLFESKVTFDENGTGVGNASPFRGNCTIKITDKNTGAITFTRVDGDSTYNERGYIDLSTGIVVMTKGSVYDSVYFMVPSTYSIKEADVNGAVWTDSKAISYGAECAFEFKHAFNFFVYDGQVYFGAKYTDFDNNSLEGKDCATANFVYAFDAQGNKIQAFARNASGTLQVTDGLEGSYTDSTYKVVLNGVGGATIDGKAGVYVKATDKDYYELYVGESVEAATEYYTFTLAGKTISVTKPTATFVFKGTDEEIQDREVFINVTTTLPTPAEKTGYLFKGWKVEGVEGTETLTYKATVATEIYTFEASWTNSSQLTVKGLLAEDEAAYGSKAIGYGDTYVSALPNYAYNTTFNEGYTFVGWVLDNGDGVLGDDDADIQDGDAVNVVGANIVVFAKWEWAGNVSFVEQDTYAWEYVAESNSWRSTNWHATCASGSHTYSKMQIQWTSGVAVIEFDYWVTGEQGYDYLTIWYYDSTGARKSIITKGADITKENAKHLVCILDAEGEDISIEYSKDSSGNGSDGEEDRAFVVNLKINGVPVYAQNALFENAGTYKNGENEITVGASGLLTIGANNYVYSQESATVIGATVEGVYKEFTLDTTAKTYTVTEPKVTVTYDYKGHGTNSSAQVSKYSNQTLSTDVPTADGFVFRGWYTDAELTTEAPATFYAKWDAAVTLTYKYLDGTTADVVENYYVNDKVATLKAVDFKFGTKAFAGWFTNDGSETGDYGTEFVKDTVLTANTTVYAKWVEPNALMGTYVGYEIYNDSTCQANKALTIDVFGNATGEKSGSVTGYNAETGFFKFGSSYAYFDAEHKMIVVSYNSSLAFGSDTYFFFQADSVSTSASNLVSWNSNKTRLITFTVDGNETNVFLNDTAVYYGVTWSAVDSKDAAVTALSDVKSKADIITIVAGEQTLKFAKSSSNNFVVTDGNEGTYASGSDSVRLNGAGVITGTFNGTAFTGTYKAAANDAGYGFDVTTTDKKATYTLSINKDDKSYTMAENRVTITYVNGKVTVESASVFRNVSTTLYAGDDLAVSGFKFRGWFDNAEFDGSAKTSVTPTGDVTFYAKYDKVATLAFNFNGYSDAEGNTGISVADKYVGDTVGELPTVLDTVKYDGKAFAGWFLKNEDGSFGAEASASTTLVGDLTYYAKWVVPAAATGTYKGLEIYYTWSKTDQKPTTTILTINDDGSFSGIVSGKLSETDMKQSDGSIVAGRFGYVNVAEGVLLMNFNSVTTTLGNDIYIGFRDSDNITGVDFSGSQVNGCLVAWITVKYQDNTTKNFFVYNDKLYANVTWKSGTASVAANACSKTDTLVIYDENGAAFLKKEGSTYKAEDGKKGVYTNSDAYGQIYLDGYGTITVGEATGSYTLDGDKVTFVAGNAMRVITLAGSAYTKTLDGYEGTYTLPDASTLALDGYGNVAGTTKTYVVNGTNITIYDGETSTAYGLDVANKELLGKSVFAGKTFKGTYTDGTSDKETQSVKIVFDDSASLTGKIYLTGDSWNPGFVAVITGNTIVFTLDGTSNYSASTFDGKTITATIEGNTFKFTDTTISTYIYKINNGTAKLVENA